MKQSTTICHAGKSDLLAAAHLAFFGQQHIQRGISGSNDRIIGVHGLCMSFSTDSSIRPSLRKTRIWCRRSRPFYIDLFHILLGYLVLLAALLQQQVDCLIFTLRPASGKCCTDKTAQPYQSAARQNNRRRRYCRHSWHSCSATGRPAASEPSLGKPSGCGCAPEQRHPPCGSAAVQQ